MDGGEQHPIGKAQGPGTAAAAVGAAEPQAGHDLAELVAPQAGQRTDVMGSEGLHRESHLEGRPTPSF